MKRGSAGLSIFPIAAFVLVCCSHVHAQMTSGLNKDSLRHLLVNAPQDTNRVLLYITLGQQYEANDMDSALQYYSKAGELSKRIDYVQGVLKYISNYTAVLNVQGKLDESIRMNREAVRLSTRHNLKLAAAKAYGNLGVVYQYREAYDSAVKFYLKALPLMERFGSSQVYAVLLNNLAGVYRNLNQSDKGLTYAQRAVIVSEKAHDLFSEGQARVNLANCYKDMGDVAQAEINYQRSLTIAKKTDDLVLLGTVLVNLGYTYLAQGRAAIPTFKQALALADSIDDVSGQAFALLGIGEGFYRTQKWKEAERYLEQGIQFSHRHDQKDVLQKLYNVLSNVYVATHRFKDAERTRALQDSVAREIVNSQILQSVQSLEAQYRLEQKQNELLTKDLELQRASADSARQRYWLVAAAAGIAVLTLVLIASWLFYRQRQMLNRQTVEKLRADQENVTLLSLLEGQQQERARISQEIHDDMGSGLTSILFISRSLAASGAEASYTGRLSGLASSLIEKMNEIVWATRGEPELLEDFIVRVRSVAEDILGTAGISYQYDVSQPVPAVMLPSQYRHPIYLILKEALHNIVKHSGATRVTISWTFLSSWTIVIADNGKGIADTSEGSGNGLRNMRRRAASIRGQVQITRSDGTHVKLEVPAVL